MKRTTTALVTSVALCALIAGTETSAFGGHGGGVHMGGGGGGGGGGFHAGGFGGFHSGGMSAFHAGGVGIPGAYTARPFTSHGLATRPISSRGLYGRNYSYGRNYPYGRNYSSYAHHPNSLTGHGLTRHALGGNQLTGHGVSGRLAAHEQIAHNQLAHNLTAQHFHGVKDFNHTGFNRNALGKEEHWNRWANHFWGPGWHRWGWGWGCWAGPVFWPFLYGDIFTFAFWPYDYYDPFWAIGIDFLLAGIFAPGPYFGPELGYAPDYYGSEGVPSVYYNYPGAAGAGAGGGQRVAKSPQVDRETTAETNAEAVQSCAGLAPGVTNLPIQQIRQSIHPSAEQETLLDELGSASSDANAVIERSCPKEVPLTPLGRLDSVEKRIDAMTEAVQNVHAPLEKLYGSLSSDQKQRFDTMEGSGRTGSQGEGLAALCGRQSADVAKLPVERIKQVVQPNEQQQNAFDDLMKASESAAADLQGSCPAEMPKTPMARLNAVTTRLNAMSAALKNIRPKLEGFYATLDDEQKARFNTIGPPPQTASPKAQHQSGDE